MNKKTTQKVNYIANQLENGIEELGKENDIIFEANTFIKTKKANMPPFIFLVQQFAKVFSEKIYFFILWLYWNMKILYLLIYKLFQKILI